MSDLVPVEDSPRDEAPRLDLFHVESLVGLRTAGTSEDEEDVGLAFSYPFQDSNSECILPFTLDT
jgi:hypothetical protein